MCVDCTVVCVPVDDSIRSVTQLVKDKGMWDDTLVVFSADNGGPIYWSGIGGANNWPLRGGKGSNFEVHVQAANMTFT